MRKLEERKEEHVRIALEEPVTPPGLTTGFEDVHLVHDAISDLDLDDVRITSMFETEEISSPIIISSMTGGFPGAKEINRNLARAAEVLRIPMAIGSVRAGLSSPSSRDTYSIVREVAPNIIIISNIGAQQLRSGGFEIAMEAIDIVKADAIAIHFNKLQEVIMPEGEPRMRGTKEKIIEVIDKLEIPCIAKETGCGISMEAARDLKEMGFDYVDVSGAGGTNFAVIETYRAMRKGVPEKAAMGRLFANWGIPTSISIIEASYAGAKVIASGGITDGLNGAKALALGARYIGVARPLLEQAVRGHEHVIKWIRDFQLQLKIAMFLSGAKDIEELRKKPVVVTGKVREWTSLRGIEISNLARR